MPPMNSAQITSLTQLAAATAAYESAWRKRASLPSGLVFDPVANRHIATPEAAEADEAMNAAYRAQQAAADALVESGVPIADIRAYESALVVATCRTENERPERFVDPDGPTGGGIVQCIQFVRDRIAEGGLV